MQDEYDFSQACRARDVPHRMAWRARAQAGKQRITVMMDTAVLDAFRQRAAETGVDYQTLIHAALRYALQPESAPVTRAQLTAELDARLPPSSQSAG